MRIALFILLFGLGCLLEAACAHGPACKWDKEPAPDSGCPDSLRWGG